MQTSIWPTTPLWMLEIEIRNKLKPTNLSHHNCLCQDVKINNKGVYYFNHFPLTLFELWGSFLRPSLALFSKAAEEDLAGKPLQSDRAFLNLNTFKTLETMQMAWAPHLLKKWCNLNPEGCFTFRLNSMWQGINRILAYKRLH